jgi:UDP-N-acetylmuramyl pentapeptide phosphotransferase/UDP-N-acetylglucosamine-1-phosphate transferase
MARHNPRAGGVFIMLAIIAGLVVGVLRGNPMEGVLAGTIVGVAAAVLLWLMDRRSR